MLSSSWKLLVITTLTSLSQWTHEMELLLVSSAFTIYLLYHFILQLHYLHHIALCLSMLVYWYATVTTQEHSPSLTSISCLCTCKSHNSMNNVCEPAHKLITANYPMHSSYQRWICRLWRQVKCDSYPGTQAATYIHEFDVSNAWTSGIAVCWNHIHFESSRCLYRWNVQSLYYPPDMHWGETATCLTPMPFAEKTLTSFN